mmetsp:Transcript_37038/g.74772  ORF Transcript_37038/g.74772 Transcript_37038/m.74772 type:complete len:321 (+) Transcript_37038:146-1108(+)
MPACATWFSISVVFPVALYIGLVEQCVPSHTSRSNIERGQAALECEATDDAAAIQKFILKSRSNASEASGDDGAGVRFFPSKGVLREMPKVPRSWPKALQGVYWLDQRGVYGFSDLRKTFNDLCISFDGPDVTFDPTTRVVTIFTSGLSWTWFNDAKGYGELAGSRSKAHGYEFHYNPEYTVAQIIPFTTVPNLGKVRVPTAVLSFTTTTLFPEPWECPPKPGAAKEQVSKCAAARRDSTWFTPYPPFFNRQVYHIFRIGDEDHRPIQPYFDAYLKFAETTSAPDPKRFQEEFGAPLPRGAEGKHSRVQMVGTRLPSPAR